MGIFNDHADHTCDDLDASFEETLGKILSQVSNSLDMMPQNKKSTAGMQKKSGKGGKGKPAAPASKAYNGKQQMAKVAPKRRAPLLDDDDLDLSGVSFSEHDSPSPPKKSRQGGSGGTRRKGASAFASKALVEEDCVMKEGFEQSLKNGERMSLVTSIAHLSQGSQNDSSVQRAISDPLVLPPDIATAMAQDRTKRKQLVKETGIIIQKIIDSERKVPKHLTQITTE